MLGEVGPLHKLMKWIEGLRDDENISIFITVLDLFLTLYSSACFTIQSKLVNYGYHVVHTVSWLAKGPTHLHTIMVHGC